MVFKKNFSQLIKILNETMDSSTSVKGEAARAPFGLSTPQVEENKILYF